MLISQVIPKAQLISHVMQNMDKQQQHKIMIV